MARFVAISSLVEPEPRPRSRRGIQWMLALAACGLLIALGCGDESDARLAQARAQQSSGDFAGSVLLLHEFLADDGRHPEANLLLGHALVQIGQPARAIEPLRRAMDSDVYSIAAGLMLASTLFQTGSFPEAVRVSDHVLEADADNLTALFTRGQSHLALDDAEKALGDAERILTRKPEAQNALMLKGGALIDLGRRDEAESIWLDLRERTAKSEDPNRAARACAQLALFYRTQDEIERADSTYSECLEAHPANPYLARWASDFYLRNRQPERAIEIHRRAVEAAPENIRTWGRLAEILFAHGSEQDARTTLEETVERFDSPAAWRLLADFHRKAGHATEARKALEEAIQRTQQPNEMFYFSLGELLVQEGEFERARKIAGRLTDPGFRHLLEGAIELAAGEPAKALVALEAGLEVWPGNPGAQYLLGVAARQAGDPDRAIRAFREARRLSRINGAGESATDAAFELAEIYAERGELRTALRFAQEQIATRPYVNPEAHQLALRAARELGRSDRAAQLAESLGWIHHRRGEYREAIDAFRTALESNAKIPSVRYRLGLSLLAAGNVEEAESLLAAVVNGPDFPEIEAARTELARIRGS